MRSGSHEANSEIIRPDQVKEQMRGYRQRPPIDLRLIAIDPGDLPNVHESAGRIDQSDYRVNSIAIGWPADPALVRTHQYPCEVLFERNAPGYS